MPTDNPFINLKMMRIQMEYMFVKKVMSMGNMTPTERANMNTLARVFEKHGIGVLEGIDIVTELAASFAEDTK